MTNLYTLDDIKQITFDSFNFTIHPNILKIINNLSAEVGSPTYIKTPIFKKKNQLFLDKQKMLEEEEL